MKKRILIGNFEPLILGIMKFSVSCIFWPPHSVVIPFIVEINGDILDARYNFSQLLDIQNSISSLYILTNFIEIA